MHSTTSPTRLRATLVRMLAIENPCRYEDDKRFIAEVHGDDRARHWRLPRWTPASRSRRSWRRAPSNPDLEALKASRSRGDRVRPLDSLCPGDSVTYPGAWGVPLPLPPTATCAMDANPPPGPSLSSKVQFVPSSGYRPRYGQGHCDDGARTPFERGEPYLEPPSRSTRIAC
jgi:hypothetical protein